MNKSCDNCYWRRVNNPSKFCILHATRPVENLCEHHSVGCEHCKAINYSAIAKYKYVGEQYCEECMANRIGIERRERIVIQYFDSYGDFIGDGDSMDLEDIFLSDSMIECLEGE